LPPPLLTEVIVMKLALLLTVQAQSLALEVKPDYSEPPPAVTEALVVESVNAHLPRPD